MSNRERHTQDEYQRAERREPDLLDSLVGIALWLAVLWTLVTKGDQTPDVVDVLLIVLAVQHDPLKVRR